MKKRLGFLLTSGMMFISAFGAFGTPGKAEAEENKSFVPGQAIVCFKSDKSKALSEKEQDVYGDKKETEIAEVDEADAIIDISGETMEETTGESDRGIITLVESDTLSTEELIAEMEKRDDVIYAEPNSVLTTAASKDYTGEQYNAAGTYSLGIADWNTYDVSGNPTPSVDSSGYVVAVCDSGVDYNHEDLKNVMWDEGLNYPELVALGGGKYGLNACNNNSAGELYDSTDPFDDGLGHGTHVAGIIAAEWNGIGVSGMTCGAKLMAVKITNNGGSGTLEESIRGYEYVIAARKAGVNVRVINNSWHDEVYGHTMDILVREAGELGIISVCAAGNKKENLDNKSVMQSSFRKNPYAIIVGAVDEEGEPTDFSNYGKRSVDIFAPGDQIISTGIQGAGEIDLEDPPYQTDGKTYEVDYSDPAVTVTDNRDNSIFGFHRHSNDDYKCNLSKVNIPGVGDVLKVEPDNSEGWVCLETDELGDISDSIAIVVELYTDKKGVYGVNSFSTAYKETDETDENRYDGLAEEIDGEGKIGVEYPRSMDKKNGKFIIRFMADYFENPEYVYIKNMHLITRTIAYVPMSGTSMATPAVTGEVMNVIAAFPDESAEKIVARIKGSVMERDSLKDLCLSGGIARQDKALAGDTKPVLNEVSQSGNKLQIDGFFFGDTKGKVIVGGTEYPADSWSDTSVTLTLPSDIKADEYKVEIVGADGKNGYRYERIGTPKNLYERLPLPGRSLSGTPGNYTVTSTEFDDTFYCNEMKSLVGLDGSLYAIIATRDLKTAIYRYDIDSAKWEMVYHGGHEAETGACTWKGKILFFANDSSDSKGYTAVFDPETKDVTYTLSEPDNKNVKRSIVNSGKGVYTYGGSLAKHDQKDTVVLQSKVKKLNEETMVFEEITNTGSDTSTINDDNASLVYDESGNFYSLGGLSSEYDSDTVLKMTPNEDSVNVEILSKGVPIIDNRDKVTQLRLSAVPTESGIMFSGSVAVDSDYKVVADTFTGAFGATHFEPTDKLVSLSPVYSIACAAYRDKYYAIGVTNYEEGAHVFASTDIKTIPQPGDVVRVKSSSGEGGSFDREGTVKSYVGANETFKINVEAGYRVSSIKIDGVELSADELAKAVASGYYTFESLKKDHEIEITFVKEDNPIDPPPAPSPSSDPTPAPSADNSKKSTAVSTGDETSPVAGAIVMIISSVGIAGTVMLKKGKHKNMSV